MGARVLRIPASLLTGTFQPLRDTDGEPYPPTALPCVAEPGAWDWNAAIAVQRVAAEICRTECPALKACQTRRESLGWHLASGVWGGKVPEQRPERRKHYDDGWDEEGPDGPVVHDATVAAWATAASMGVIVT